MKRPIQLQSPVGKQTLGETCPVPTPSWQKGTVTAGSIPLNRAGNAFSGLEGLCQEAVNPIINPEPLSAVRTVRCGCGGVRAGGLSHSPCMGTGQGESAPGKATTGHGLGLLVLLVGEVNPQGPPGAAVSPAPPHCLFPSQ